MKLFEPILVGDSSLLHRVVLAPLTRQRATDAHVPGLTMPAYYAQRACVSGTLLVSEATLIAAKAGGSPNVPGVTSAVHVKGSFIYLQLWALGRAANPAQLAKERVSGGYVSSSSIAQKRFTKDGLSSPRTLDIAEIHEYIQLHATAAENAIKAGFDGVELHGANGYLIDQFIQDVSNKRTDDYGGSIENRARFALEVVDAVVKAIGAKKTGIRFSPWGFYGDMRMTDPIPTFSYLVSSLLSAHPDLAFVHVIEPRVNGASDRADEEVEDHEQNDFIREIARKASGSTKIISNGGYTRQQAIDVAEEKGDLVAFGRAYIANPDLPTRLKDDIPLTRGNRETYYMPGNFTGLGYTDYPFADEPSRN
ncbi:FMN-linked oxidoreductase [Athelia psychrophila]|uniref:FMN-linked oxidoreductase n=2 Tax=Athelia psychrophila TaxID=1759441 RepID=A0A166W6Q8_9AGAM|nr:FMN-linked oxidoreductase [Fibularhizoctonia sp. CBS 109695]